MYVNSYTITLTSLQTLSNADQLNHYLFVDPVVGVNFPYPLTSNGGENWGVATATVSGGLFFPWGYVFQTNYQFITAGVFKGPHTITFSPSGIDTRYFGILKIVYDFGDGTSKTIERDVIPNNPDTALTSGDPTKINVAHDYWPKNNLTTFTPSITVLNGSLTQDVFLIDIRFTPTSIHEFKDVKLINVAQNNNKNDETFGVIELNKPDKYVTAARFFSAGETQYNDASLLIDLLNKDNSNLILNLDASDALTVIKNSENQVQYWYDKSNYKNDFSQNYKPHRPIFKYDTETQSNRKSVAFNSITQGLTGVRATGFASLSNGYTFCFVMKANAPVGTVFSLTSGGLVTGLTNTEISQAIAWNRPLADDEISSLKSGLRDKWNIS